MDFRIADTFTDSLAKLTGEEQKAVKTTAFDLQMNPANPGMSFHKLDKARDQNFWSVRVSSDIRLIVHRNENSLLLCYVDHHDKAYQWAERRKLETHPTTGAAQLVEIRETVKEIVVPAYVKGAKPALFADISDNDLLSYGVPHEWLGDVRKVNEDSLFSLAERLPREASEALLELATGGKPKVTAKTPSYASPFDHPDAQRRFRVMNNVEELEQAFEAPWEKWIIFLHPDQRQLVERNYNGPVKVSGSAGTGKTIVALHRAVYLARQNPDSRVLMTTFSEALANALRERLRWLIRNNLRLADRLEIHSIQAIGRRLYEANFGRVKLATPEILKQIIAEAGAAVKGHKFNQYFLSTEWQNIVDDWQLKTWEDYRDVSRLGRKTRLSETQRAVLWQIFEIVISELSRRQIMTMPQVFARITEHIGKLKNPPFDFAIVDEAQDIGIPELRFLAALGGKRPNSLFFAGDTGQRIFQQPFSWKNLGVDIRGRSFSLRVNYRTSHQIRCHADALLPSEISDVDGNKEDRRGTISVFDGIEPVIKVFDSAEQETKAVAHWLKRCNDQGVLSHEIGIFVRSDEQLSRAEAAVAGAGFRGQILDDNMKIEQDFVTIGTMHLAKGLEFRAVAVMACDDEVIPLQSRIDKVTDESDLDDVYHTERYLLYVACTRARDCLSVTGVIPASEFLNDLQIRR